MCGMFEPSSAERTTDAFRSPTVLMRWSMPTTEVHVMADTTTAGRNEAEGKTPSCKGCDVLLKFCSSLMQVRFPLTGRLLNWLLVHRDCN